MYTLYNIYENSIESEDALTLQEGRFRLRTDSTCANEQ